MLRNLPEIITGVVVEDVRVQADQIWVSLFYSSIGSKLGAPSNICLLSGYSQPYKFENFNILKVHNIHYLLFVFLYL